MGTKLADYTTKPLAECTKLELFNGLLDYVTDAAKEKGFNQGKKKIYYISAEFLIGKLLSNNLINLGMYDSVKQELAEAGKSLTDLEEFEYEPSLGNGGLGRLAACFLDSLATLGLPADGIGLAYHCGLFHQSFVDNKQYESPDYWLKWGQESWMQKTDTHYDVTFGDVTVKSTMYDIIITGYEGKSGHLYLFDTDSVDERAIKNRISFDKENVAKNLTLFLYPDDSDEAGRMLRVYQEYFMVSNGAQHIIEECEAKGCNLHDLADYAAIQINDTHPTMVIPELIRILTARGIDFDEACEIVTKVCGYTNHTILAEALEKWPRYYLDKVVPQLMPIIDRLNAKVAAKYSEPFVQIIDKDNNIHMANIDIHFSHSVNGVAALHTEILKKSELAPFYRIYPEKFNNKTNGITFRRWILECNPSLASLIDSKVGRDWHHDADGLEALLPLVHDDEFLNDVINVKKENKKAFAAWLEDHQGTKINPDSVFDVQSKRLHEYKRQQLNLLWAIHMYQEIKAGKRPAKPVTVIFGAKAAPAYIIAKDIIHAIICLGKVIEADPDVSPFLKVVMIENYNITAAEKLIPAADISEQISLASKEASGTGNMKFMLNGALTLGTMDGANVEIANLVGKDNIYTFGLSSDEVISHYSKGDYVSRDYYDKDGVLKAAVNFLTGPEMLAVGDEKNLRRLSHELLTKDYFMTFPDFKEYVAVKERVLEDYTNRKEWTKKAVVNIARAGFFSSDRTIEQYNEDIWGLTPDVQ
ncbi:MAG: glycogen/starch/alpha-glucan phosphorylase [Lachnospiraceae bacterium]|nr:glycogen/starch/alpha-glucan phosphorylase [Lachnospiraceae bacterium]